ncbi:basigin [Tetranychus urticae]|nr:basigin [Tetranychus urticae]
MIIILPFLMLIHGAEFVVMERSKEYDLESGGPVTIECLPPGSSGFDIKWYKVIDAEKSIRIHGNEERYKLYNNNTTLTIEDPRKSADEADYVCSVGNPSGKTSNQTFRVRGKPEFTNFKAAEHTKDMNSFNVIENDDLHLICEVVLKPHFKEDEIDFSWFRKFSNGSEERITNLNITFDEELDGRSNIVKKSTLIMDDVKFGDRAQYICEAANGGIKANSTVDVRVKDKLGALWPFLGIVAEVVILCTVICVYEKKRNKPEFEESENSDAKHSKMSR